MNNENPINFINGEAHHYDEKKKKKLGLKLLYFSDNKNFHSNVQVSFLYVYYFYLVFL